jgi:hypothetical protein
MENEIELPYYTFWLSEFLTGGVCLFGIRNSKTIWFKPEGDHGFIYSTMYDFVASNELHNLKQISENKAEMLINLWKTR